MKKVGIAAVFLAAILLVTTAYAGSATFAGNLSPGGPQEPQVAQITTPNCTGTYVAFAILYQAFPFTVGTTGMYTITEPGVESAVYIYQYSFDPALPANNCLAASNSNPINFSVMLTAGTTYYVVVVEDSFNQDGMPFSITISGPGTVTLINPSCPYPLPSGSVVYSVPGGAPTFFAPRLDAQNNFLLPAGTWYISEFSGNFAKVWMSCQGQPFYIPANAVVR